MILQKNNNNSYGKYDFERFDNTTDDRHRVGYRDEFERDYGRIIHSAAFRRLQGKTQVFGPSEGDFHRTRLTHTLEVSQIARGIAIQLNGKSEIMKNNELQIDISLVESGSLAHDLGHPPYGHQGERALNHCMEKFGGFEGNAHTFRLLTNLESNKKIGLNLTRATLLSIIKYPILFDNALNEKAEIKNPPKSNIFNEDKKTWDWILECFSEKDIEYFTETKTFTSKHKKTVNKTLECSIVELADDIAYATHDLQDVLKFGLLKIDKLKEILVPVMRVHHEKLSLQLSKLGHIDIHENINGFIKELINFFIQDIKVLKMGKDSLRLNYKAGLSDRGNRILNTINDLIHKEVIQSQRVQTMEWKGNLIVTKLFDAFMNTPMLLPEDRRYKENDSNPIKGRIVCDYIAGMTDKYAENFYRRLYETNGGRLFDI